MRVQPFRDKLAPWIQPQHLEDWAIARLRKALSGSSNGAYVVEDFLVEQLARRVWTFFANEALFDVQRLLYPAQAVSETEWRESEPEKRFSRDAAFVGVSADHQMSVNLRSFFQLRTGLRGSAFAHWLEAITGIPLAIRTPDDIGYVERMEAGDFVGRHTDESRGRVVGAMLHLSKDWTPSLGGTLWTQTKWRGTFEIPTGWNRLVIMLPENDVGHGVTTIGPTDLQRIVVRSWFVRGRSA